MCVGGGGEEVRQQQPTPPSFKCLPRPFAAIFLSPAVSAICRGRIPPSSGEGGGCSGKCRRLAGGDFASCVHRESACSPGIDCLAHQVPTLLPPVNIRVAPQLCQVLELVTVAAVHPSALSNCHALSGYLCILYLDGV